MRKIKIAQIGLNTYSHSTEIFESLKKQQDIFEIVGYVLPENEQERLPEKAKALEGYRELTLEEVLNDPETEAVAIETDEIYLTKYALLCAKASKHIHMEKPGGQNLADFEELISAMKKTGKVFHTGYMYRYNPEVVRLMERVKGGQLGQDQLNGGGIGDLNDIDTAMLFVVNVSGAELYRALSRCIDLFDLLVIVKQCTATRKIGSLDQLHHLFHGKVGLAQQSNGTIANLSQVE